MGYCTITEQENFFNQLYDSQFQKMWKYAVVILANQDLAEEVVQDAFLEAYLHIDFLATCEKPEWWLQRTVKHKALHMLREQAKNIRRLVSLDAEIAIHLPATDEFERVEDNEQGNLTQVKQKIASALTEEDLHLLKRVALEGASYKQVSREMSLSIPVCQKRIQRVRKKLKIIFQLFLIFVSVF